MGKKAARPDLHLVVDNSAEADAKPAVAPSSPEQVEMPFAIVNGEAITQLPKDLYIPPQALEVFLDAFEGPLDLLLYMIRRQNLDILDIPIADITKQYMEYIGLMADMQLELAGEYLVMAATLAEIKSRMLLPRAVGSERRRRGRSARRPRAPPAGIRTLQDRRREHRPHPAHGSRYLGRRRRARRTQDLAAAAADRDAGNAVGIPRRRAAHGNVRAPSRPARAAVGARAHV